MKITLKRVALAIAGAGLLTFMAAAAVMVVVQPPPMCLSP